MTPDQAALPYRACVGVVLIDTAGRIFAGQRIDSEVAAWQMPQGGIDADEDARAAALRELHEEIGVPAELVQVVDETPGWLTYDLPDHLIGKVWKGRFRGQKQRWFLMRFLGRDGDIRLDTEHPEFSEWCWLTADELLSGIVPFKRAVYDQVIAAFRPHLA
jgi:putative (di)nucleoside polyphosphate hydrolase